MTMTVKGTRRRWLVLAGIVGLMLVTSRFETTHAAPRGERSMDRRAPTTGTQSPLGCPDMAGPNITCSATVVDCAGGGFLPSRAAARRAPDLGIGRRGNPRNPGLVADPSVSVPGGAEPVIRGGHEGLNAGDASIDPAVERARIEAKLRTHGATGTVQTHLDPDVWAIEPDALDCPMPCTTGTLSVDNDFYDVALDCVNGAFTARTGVIHPVTISSGAKQNVIFGGTGLNTGTSDITFHVHNDGSNFLDPSPALGACVFDPPDTPGEPNSLGVAEEWIQIVAGMELTFREEIVAFGSTPDNSGVRMTLSVSNSDGSFDTANMGVRWQIDYQNAGDDGPLWGRVVCDPFEVVEELDTSHEFLASEVLDFARLQNNTSDPIFGNYTSTVDLAGYPGTATPDRLLFSRWSAVNASPWNVTITEGENADSDSAGVFYYGYLPEDGFLVAPGETNSRSLIIFTAADDNIDCGDFQAGTGDNAELTVCPGSCVELGAEATDDCEVAEVTVEASAGAPPCDGPGCVVEFADEGTYTYTFTATDIAGNSTSCTTTVTVDYDSQTCHATDFSGFSAGDVVTSLPGATVTGSGDIVAFDTSAVTCDDFDLMAMIGNVLVVQEAGSACVPDDDADGGLIRLDFDEPGVVGSVNLVDIDEMGTQVRVYDAAGGLLGSADVVVGGNAETTSVAFDLCGVSAVEIELGGSGAFAGITCP
ncbi:MAG: hypothetical protein AAF533_11455 [Acidobacteriota bacterium]